jgi:hypothetical protein
VKRGGRGRGRLGGALTASALLHGGAIVLLWAFASSGPQRAPLKVYAVDIVSPPPREAGETAPERVAAAAEPVEEPSAAEPEPAPAPEPAPEPAPQRPAPPPPAAQPAPQRPAPTPPPAAQPAPQRPAPTPPAAQPPPQRPPPTPPREQAPAQRPTTPPAATRPAPAEPRPAPAAPAPTAPREGEPAPRPAPSTGAQPSPTSPGGENLAVRTEGAVCPSAAYCNNIAAMVQRYFRRPPDAYSDRGDVCFRIARSGAVSDLEVQRLRGSFAFRLALMEAVEQAGRRNEFGPLPREFGSDWLPVCVGVTPQM